MNDKEALKKLESAATDFALLAITAKPSLIGDSHYKRLVLALQQARKELNS